MPKQDPMEALKRDPKAAQLLGDQAALSALLQSKEAQTIAQLLQKVDAAQLQKAAQAAAGGDGGALGAIVERLRSSPEGAKAMEAMEKKAK